jgi:hypothetical protein
MELTEANVLLHDLRDQSPSEVLQALNVLVEEHVDDDSGRNEMMLLIESLKSRHLEFGAESDVDGVSVSSNATSETGFTARTRIEQFGEKTYFTLVEAIFKIEMKEHGDKEPHWNGCILNNRKQRKNS